MQTGEPGLFKSRVALAALLSSSYGVYSGFELLEHEALPDREEYLDSEKYQLKPRDWNKVGNIKDYIATLNRLRRGNAALQQTQNLRFLQVDDDQVVGFVKESVDFDQAVAVAIAVAGGSREFWLHFGELRVGPVGNQRPVLRLEDLVTGERRKLEWGGVRLTIDADREPALFVSLLGVRSAMNVAPDLSTISPAVANDWYKDAIVYQLHVKAFADSNDDGIGDFKGLMQRLDYLQDLGVTALWLQPFYPSPGRDDGYDISDYRRINADFGTMNDFRRFMSEAKNRGLKVITELVINHTSDQHPWFRRARRSPPGSAARNWYVWSDTDQRAMVAHE